MPFAHVLSHCRREICRAAQASLCHVTQAHIAAHSLMLPSAEQAMLGFECLVCAECLQCACCQSTCTYSVAPQDALALGPHLSGTVGSYPKLAIPLRPL